jgi:membrane protein implicated in regulation of membrane protease activity
MAERRHQKKDDTGERRRHTDEREEFALLRDKVLLIIGAAIVAVIGAASVFLDIRNQSIALAVLAVGATLLGAPTVLRWDESKGHR